MWLSIHASPLNASNLDGPIQSGRDVSEREATGSPRR
jgi:hypothetical protein